MRDSNKKILLGICGGIAAYKVCELIRLLKRNGYAVRCIMTEAARKFITPLTIQTLSGEQVHTDLFAEYYNDPGHVALADYPDLIVLAPATADTLAKAACGLAGDLLSSTLLSTDRKILVCPAMHTNMWKSKITQENVQKLKGIGYSFIGPESGSLASGGEGIGRLAPVETIYKRITELTK